MNDPLHPTSFEKLNDGDNAELDYVLNDLRDLFSEETDEDTTEEEEDIEREVRVEFDIEVARMFGVSGVEFSVRDLLSWMSYRMPEQEELFIAIRDEFYSDQEEDYVNPRIAEGGWGPFGPEARAEARRLRSQIREERLARRMRIEAEIEAERVEVEAKLAEDEVKWRPFLAEREALKMESRLLHQRADELDTRWDSFVADRAVWGPDMAALVADRRAELEIEGKRLNADWDVHMLRAYDLRKKANVKGPFDA